MLRVRKEVSKIFIGFLTKIPSSLYKNVKTVFYRREYQSNSGSLVHDYTILDVN